MDMSEGLQVVMSPVQMAAVLSDKTVTEAETMQNRLLGGLGVAMSTVELAGATILCAAPDPTTLTKAACIVVGAHGLDSLNAAIDQTISGRDTRTAAYQLAVDTARSLGADEKTAMNIGLTVDIAVPVAFGLALGAARVASVRVGRIRLIEHESATGFKPGGHTIARHVGKSREELLARLERRTDITGASTFTNISVAERAISHTLKANLSKIKAWSMYHQRPLVLEHSVGYTVGSYIKRGSTELMRSNRLKVVLEYKAYNGKPYYVLTAYPTW